jgi:hypothetical protein
VGFFITTHYTPLKEELRDASKSRVIANKVTLIVWRAGNGEVLKNVTRFAGGGDLRHLTSRKGSFGCRNVLGGMGRGRHRPFRG